VAEADEIKAKATPEFDHAMVENIIIKTQGFVSGNFSEGDSAPVQKFRDLLALYKDIDKAKLQDNMKTWLEAIMPICDEYDRYKTKTFEEGNYKYYIMQKKVIENGVNCAPKYTLMEKKAYYNTTLMHFSPSERRLINPHYYKVDISDDLYNLKMSIITRLTQEIKNFK
jgi:hypothetical protein